MFHCTKIPCASISGDSSSYQILSAIRNEVSDSVSPHSGSDIVADIAKEVGALSAQSGRCLALRHALTATEPLLKSPTDALRIDLHKRVFRKSYFRGAGYQVNDFESVDYEQFELTTDLPMFRGPALPQTAFERGDYFCVIGAAQTFGRLVRRPWPLLLSDAISLPVLNLSRGGVGPELFLNPVVIEFVRRARFVVLQVMSGRSVGCAEYPGGRRITHNSKPTSLHRWEVLERLWRNEPRIALDYVRRWNTAYLDLYRQLRALINRPTLLLWISDRYPDGWAPEQLLQSLDWGSFPQLVGHELYESVAALFGERLEHVFAPSSEQPLSRVTGEPCPFFWTDKKLHTKFGYYPSTAANVTLAEGLLPWAREVQTHP